MTAASDAIKQAAEALAMLDVSTALAQLAAERDYARPEVDASLDFVIEGGRHPETIVDQGLFARAVATVHPVCLRNGLMGFVDEEQPFVR